MLELITAFQNGGIGLETLYHNLRQGERLPESMDTLEKFEADIEMHGATSLFMGTENEDE